MLQVEATGTEIEDRLSAICIWILNLFLKIIASNYLQ
jgi:hypothetical protein